MVLWSQWEKLQKEIGGHTGALLTGGFGGVDAAMNADAKAEAAARNGGGSPASLVPMVHPNQNVVNSLDEHFTNTTSTGVVTIRDQTGRATVTKAPTGFGLKLEPSGSP